ncbi:MAG: Uma2 family endonuclease [Deltaproteobacteria bacterium]|nr:Uma2 family endonuclease [Deltaproteobacteria bacterium]
MTFPPLPSQRPRVWDDPRIRVPDAETWAGLTPAQREAAAEAIEAVLDEYREAMSEGVRHSKRKAGVAADLDAHFRRLGRGVLLANELAVLYPGEAVIVPDVLAVMDCDPDYEPERWVVMDEKRGVDVVVEVRNLGRKHKDLVENVLDYARLRIPEYFSYDCRSGALRGWRLPEPAAQSYVPIIPQGGYLRSAVLGLDLAVAHNRLRFFANQSMVPTESELVTRLQSLVDERQLERDEAARARDDALDRLVRVQATLARGVLQTCALRGITLTAAQSARVASEGDAAVLATWAERAFSADSADAILA